MAKKGNKKNNNNKTKARGAGVRGKGNAFKGNGMYSLGAMAKALTGVVAQRVAQKVPKGSFERTGAALGRGLARFTGFGDYVMNDIVHTSARPSKSRTHTISNCEFVSDVRTTVGSSGFDLRDFTVNASTETTFPWLAAIARQYTKFRFTQLLFEYRTMSSDYSANVGLGSVVMAPIYNINQPNWVTKQQMEAATHAVSFKPSNSAVCGVECAMSDNNFKWYNVRTGSMETTPFTDPVRFTLALAGTPSAIPNNTLLGELWVHYTIELIEPLLYKAPSLQAFKVGTVRSLDTTAGIMDTRLFGLGASGNAFQGPLNINGLGGNVPGGMSSLTVFNQAPSGAADYFVGYDVTSYDRLYFRTPGYYVLDWTCTFTTTQASNTPGYFGASITDPSFGKLWGVVSPIGGVNYNVGYSQVSSNLTDRKAVHQTFLIQIDKEHAVVQFSKIAAITYSALVIDGTGNGSQLIVHFAPFTT